MQVYYKKSYYFELVFSRFVSVLVSFGFGAKFIFIFRNIDILVSIFLTFIQQYNINILEIWVFNKIFIKLKSDIKIEMEISKNLKYEHKKKVFIIGATASGKTHLSIRIAKKLKAEIINTDALQIYNHANIMTATASLAEQDGIPHHLISFLEIDDLSINIHKYLSKLDDVLQNKFENNEKIPVFVGGTHHYLEYLLYENIAEPDIEVSKVQDDSVLKKRVEEAVESQDYNEMIDVVHKIHRGSEFFKRLAKNDNLRLRNGQKRYQKGDSQIEQRVLKLDPKDIQIIYPIFDNEILYKELIADRVDKMFYKEGGYKELFQVYDIFILTVLYSKEIGGDDCQLGKNVVIENQKEFLLNCKKDDFDEKLLENIRKWMQFVKTVLTSDMLGVYLNTGVLKAIGYKEFYDVYKKASLDILNLEQIDVKSFFTERFDIGKFVKENGEQFEGCKNKQISDTFALAKYQKKWIKNRFFVDEKLVDRIYTVRFDSKSDFQNKAQDKVELLVDLFMNCNEDMICEKINNDDGVAIEKPDQRKKNEKISTFCPKCEENIIGEKEWKIHLKSKRHRKSKRPIIDKGKSKQQNLT